LILEAQEMLRKWEEKDEDTFRLWKEMNHWVLEGFDVTYKNLGIEFDKVYFESETYKLGKEIVLKGIEQGVFIKKDDGSVWVDLTDDGLDQKLLLRADGTSVYITQDIGTAHQRFADFHADELIYVVGNEQNYHFQVLKLIMNKLGYSFAEYLFHLSYGMVELPEGKMKSREGTVVDADDLIDEMIRTAEEMSRELGKLDGYGDKEKYQINRTIGLGALKYFILKVDPKKNMTFDPKESIDFNGNTGPFIQYTYARIKSVFRKAEQSGVKENNMLLSNAKAGEKETGLIRIIRKFPETVSQAAAAYSPALVANYCYELAREYNEFYHDYSILGENDESVRNLRLTLSRVTGEILNTGMWMLGIEMPERM